MFHRVIRSFGPAFLSLLLLLPFSTQSYAAQQTEKVPSSIIAISSGYVITVDKQTQRLYVFKKNGGFSRVFEAACSTGKNQGGKQVSGDAKTPHGIFFATRVIQNPGAPETYGTLALPLDYPSLTDKKAGRNGTNIWIHGTVKPLTPFQSNGCVVLSDRDIHELLKYIQINKTPIIISESISWVPQNSALPVRTELEKILSLWTKAYMDGDIKGIDTLYLEGAKMKGKKRETLLGKLSMMRSVNQHFLFEPRDVSILQQSSTAVIVFDQITNINKDNSFEGTFNRLSLEKVNNRWFIIDDVEMPAPARKSDHEMAAGGETASPAREAVRNLITKWAKSWESGDMDIYRSCYDSGFRSQGMDLNKWIHHKTAVRQNSKNIHVRVENLVISGNDIQSSAVFTQHYTSSLLKSKGRKQLNLKKSNGEWKIDKETMR